MVSGLRANEVLRRLIPSDSIVYVPPLAGLYCLEAGTVRYDVAGSAGPREVTLLVHEVFRKPITRVWDTGTDAELLAIVAIGQESRSLTRLDHLITDDYIPIHTDLNEAIAVEPPV